MKNSTVATIESMAQIHDCGFNSFISNGEENVNLIEYPLQAVTQSCDVKKIVIILLFLMLIRFLPHLLLMYIIHLSEIIFAVVLFVYFCSFFLLKI
jgi:hypothetical protein